MAEAHFRSCFDCVYGPRVQTEGFVGFGGVFEYKAKSRCCDHERQMKEMVMIVQIIDDALIRNYIQ